MRKSKFIAGLVCLLLTVSVYSCTDSVRTTSKDQSGAAQPLIEPIAFEQIATVPNDCPCENVEIEKVIPVPVDIRTAVINAAEKEIGVKETGVNTGTRINEYQKSTGNKAGDQWCASFLSFVLKENGIKETGTAYSPSWFPSKWTIHKPSKDIIGHPQPGDVFGVWVESKGRVGHVGFIYEWDDKTVTTIEGNYSDMVAKNKRITRQIYVASDVINNQSTI